jgi:hypothetical protein
MEAVSGRAWQRSPRLWLVIAAIAVPLLAAIPGTLLAWGSQSRVLPAAPTAPAIPLFDRPANATIFYVVDGDPLETTSGSVLEFLVDSAPGQAVTSSRAAVLEPIPQPPCHVQPICNLRHISEFAFVARSPGVAALTFRLGSCVAQPCGPRTLTKQVTVSAPVQVGRAPVR